MSSVPRPDVEVRVDYTAIDRGETRPILVQVVPLGFTAVWITTEEAAALAQELNAAVRKAGT